MYVRKSAIKDLEFINFPRSVLFAQLEKTGFYQYSTEDTAMTYFPDDSVLFYLPSWSL